MDEELCRSVIDLSGAFIWSMSADPQAEDRKLSVEIGRSISGGSFAETARFNLHMTDLRGRNTHHILEARSRRRGRCGRQSPRSTHHRCIKHKGAL